MKKPFLLMLVFCFLFIGRACAEQDFYGIQFRDEAAARQLVLGERVTSDTGDSVQGPLLNHAVHAEASLKELGDGHVTIRVTLFNDSGLMLSTDEHFRDFFIYSYDGKRYPLSDTETSLDLRTIPPKSSATFSPSAGNLPLRNRDVKMISCVFDLGVTKVFLFPWTKKDQIVKLTNPVVPTPLPALVLVPATKVAPIKEKKTRSELKPEAATSKTPKRNFWEWVGLKKKTKTAPEKPAPIAHAAAESKPLAASSATAAPSGGSQKKLDQAIKNFTYVPADAKTTSAKPETSSAPAALAAVSMAPAKAEERQQARIIGYDKKYQFITLNLGVRDGIQKNMVLGVTRDGRLIAKVRVKQLRDAVSAASVLPDTVMSDIKVGDKISVV